MKLRCNSSIIRTCKHENQRDEGLSYFRGFLTFNVHAPHKNHLLKDKVSNFLPNEYSRDRAIFPNAVYA